MPVDAVSDGCCGLSKSLACRFKSELSVAAVWVRPEPSVLPDPGNRGSVVVCIIENRSYSLNELWASIKHLRVRLIFKDEIDQNKNINRKQSFTRTHLHIIEYGNSLLLCAYCIFLRKCYIYSQIYLIAIKFPILEAQKSIRIAIMVYSNQDFP